MSEIVFLPDGTKLEFEAGMVDENQVTEVKLFPLRSKLFKNGREFLYVKKEAAHVSPSV